MSDLSKRNQSGDTLIEVLVAIAILSIVIVIVQTTMNFGMSIALTSVERTAVQSEMNSQFAYIRYARDEFLKNPDSAGGAMWQRIIDNYAVSAVSNPVSSNYCSTSPVRPVNEAGMFFVDETAALTAPESSFANAIKIYPGGASPVAATAAARPGQGIWIIARQGGSDPVRYIDFYIRACWASLSDSPNSQTSSVLRLYINPVATNSGAALALECTEDPDDIVLALDYSSSMRRGMDDGNPASPSRRSTMIGLVDTFITETTDPVDDNRLSVVAFNQNAYEIATLGSTAGQLKAAIENFENSTGTNLIAALSRAQTVLTDVYSDGRARTLVLFSDGEVYAANQQITAREIAYSMKDLPLDVAIHTIGISNSSDTSLMQDIAGNGGVFFLADNEDTFEHATRTIADSFKCSLGFRGMAYA